MSTQQLYEIMIQMKGLIQKNPDNVRLLLANNPQFAYALLQAQVVLGMITADVAKQVLAQSATTAAQALNMASAASGMNTGSIPGIQVPGIGNMAGIGNLGVMGNVLGPNTIQAPGLLVNPMIGQQGGLGFGFPGGQNPAAAAFAGFPLGGMMVPQQQSQLAPTELGVDEQQLLEKLLSLTDEQIEQLSPEDRQQVLEVRKTMMNLMHR